MQGQENSGVEEREEVLEDKDAERVQTPHSKGEGEGESEDPQSTYAPTGNRTSSRMSRTRSRASSVGARSVYEGNPYDIDRVNTRNSFA
jgi:hypothetical protein